ncbi:MAG: peptide-methionine (S)-S-oxide reductase MsrA [Acidobacteriaceae bacterium]
MKATFGAGCFWGVEQQFRAIAGVTDAVVGYEGGKLEKPTYQDVCSDATGHAEVVELDFDPEQVSYDQLLDAFFGLHNPTQMNRQGPDVGTQYRSAIFVHDDSQKEAAAKAIERAQEKFARPIVTRIEPAGTFWRAEDYHQQYLAKRGLSSCHV